MSSCSTVPVRAVAPSNRWICRLRGADAGGGAEDLAAALLLELRDPLVDLRGA